MPKLPLLILGDAPTQPTGLARIARDLAMRIHASDLDVDLHQIGWQPEVGSWAGWSGEWPLWTFSETKRWGKTLVQHIVDHLGMFGQPEGIVFAIWDASRAYELLPMPPGWELWLYPAVDATDSRGSFGGPAAEAVKRADRVVAYGDWAAGILGRIRFHDATARTAWLPHGIDDRYFLDLKDRRFNPYLVGCIATNQPRKDLPLFVQTIDQLRKKGIPANGWLHTDKLDGAWPISTLRQYSREGQINVTLAGVDSTDAVVRQRLAGCHVAFAPGRGEGFGYPIVEAGALGVPCVHVNYAGGAELLPVEWLIEPESFYVEPGYGLRRPVLNPSEVADRLIATMYQPDASARAQTAAGAYMWSKIWPHWKQWIARGLREFRGW